MTKELDEAIQNTKKEILNEPVVQDYLRLKKLIESSSYLTNLEKEIKYLQKCNPTEEEKEKYFSLLKKYNEDPLVIQFKNISEDVYNFLEEVKKELEPW